MAEFLFYKYVNEDNEQARMPLTEAYYIYTNIINDPFAYPCHKMKSQFHRASIMLQAIELGWTSLKISNPDEMAKMYNQYIYDSKFAPWVRAVARDEKNDLLINYKKAMASLADIHMGG